MNNDAHSVHPLRVLHLTLGADAGGLSRYVIDLCTAMRANGHFVAVAGDTGAWQELFDAAPCPYVRIPLKAGVPGFLKSSAIVSRFCRENEIDILHTHYRRATMLARRQSIHVRGEKTPLPVLYTLHLSHLNLSGPRRWLTDFGDHTHVASVDARQWLVETARVKPERISVIPHGVDVTRFMPASSDERRAARQSLHVQDDETAALFVGRFDTPKNEAWLLDVADAARRRLAKLKIILVGEGPNEPVLRAQLAARDLMGRVVVLGTRDPLPLYHAADALLLPSAREGFSLVCAEAMACGVPVFRTRTSGTTELIVEGVTGRSVAIDHDAFVSGALQFLQDTAALRQMGAAACERVRQRFDVARQVEQTVALYRSLIRRA